jgi:hypothetical protein
VTGDAPRGVYRFHPDLRPVEQEVGGSSPPNCTSTVELSSISGILLIDLMYLRRLKYKRRHKWHCEWSR